MRRILGSAIAAFALAGCVSTGTYEALQAEHEATKQELAASNRDNQSLREALAAEERKSAELGAEISRLQDAQAAMLKDKSALQGSIDEMKSALAELSRRKAEADKRIAEFKALVGKFQSLIDAGKLKVRMREGRMVVELATDVLFGSGSANLNKDGKQALAEVAQLLASIEGRKFQIEGHTDNVPIATAIFPSNWELASARALTVLKTMVDSGMPADRISAASYGDSKPAQPNDSPDGKKANRRIEIVVVPDLSGLPGFEELNRVSGSGS